MKKDKSFIIHSFFKIFTALVIVLGDQITKLLVMNTLVLQDSKEIINDFFYLTYTQNLGAAFGMLKGELHLFILVSVLSAIGMVYYYIHTKPNEKYTRYGLILLFSGMLGNLIDRILHGCVIDFIDFVIFGFNLPIFNIADIAIYLGVAFIIIEILMEEYQKKSIQEVEGN